MNSSTGRLPWIDNCKALTICFVIFFHESQFWNWGYHFLMPILHLFTASFIMPMFVMISGYCGLNSLKKNTSIEYLKSYNIKNFKRIYLPSLCVSLVLCLLRFEQFSTIKGLLGGNWFLTMLFAVLFASSFIWFLSYKITANHTLAVFVPLTFALLIFVDPVHIGEMIPFFLIGLIIKQTDTVNKYFSRGWVVLSIVLFTFILFSILIQTGLLKNTLGTFYRYNFLYFLKNGTLYFWLLRVLLSTSICLSIMALYYKFSRTYSKFSWMGSQTLSLYLFSSIPMYVWYGRKSTPMLLSNNLYDFICSHVATLYLANTIVFVLTVGLCLLLTYILGKWKYTRLLFLGKD